jgi:dihydroxyacetone kinase-like protein
MKLTFQLTSKDYVEYIKEAAALIAENKDYISGLDAATGDGDHWANINMGFEKLVSSGEELSALSVAEMFKKIGMLMMATIGGSSGVLYGSAYIAGSKVLNGQEFIDDSNLCPVLDAMVTAIMERGKAQPGFKTMIDSLYPAVDAYKDGLAKNLEVKQLLSNVKEASIQGAENTKSMEAVRGRAYYQANKGVGNLDPGAVTMSYQVSTLMDYILRKI